ncbi:MAG: hypothetical protein EOP89_06070 [Lysobacteraceae bacterium]|nr:MAG: hypothetical protein EOP89_06070 [Xanthomonadaceae bacterium]
MDERTASFRGHSRHALRGCDIDDALRKTAIEFLVAVFADVQLKRDVHRLQARAGDGDAGAPAHHALADAIAGLAQWPRIPDAAKA